MQLGHKDAELISIIIPVYNVSKYIRKCLESALMQSYPEIEILVIDDGSTDRTANVVNAVMRLEPRIRYIGTENLGVSAARNRGLREARGSYCVFLDGDDTLPFVAVEMMINHAKKENADLVFGGMRFAKIDRNGAKKETRDHSLGFFVGRGADDIRKRLSLMIEENYIQSSCAKLYKLDFLRQHNILFDESLDSFEDMNFVLSCIHKSPCFCMIPDICYEYCLRAEESNSRRYKPDMDKQMLSVASRVDAFCSDIGSDLSPFDSLRLHLFVNSVNSIFGLYDSKLAAQKVNELCETPTFRRLFETPPPQSNCYGKVILLLCSRKAWPAVCVAARFRNFIRGMTGQPVI